MTEPQAWVFCVGMICLTVLILYNRYWRGED